MVGQLVKSKAAISTTTTTNVKTEVVKIDFPAGGRLSFHEPLATRFTTAGTPKGEHFTQPFRVRKDEGLFL